MRPRPANYWGKQPSCQAMPPQNQRQMPEEKTLPKEEAVREEIPQPTNDPPLYRFSAAIADQQIAPNDVLNWGQSSIHLHEGSNLLLLNITFVTENEGQAHWTLYAGEQKAAELSCACRAYQPTTIMLHTYLQSEGEKNIIVKNTANQTLIVQQGSVNILALEK